MNLSFKKLLLLFACWCGINTCFGKVIKIKVDSREPILSGKSFGIYGPYELIKGRIYFAYDPENTANAIITDIQLAPVNEKGLVEAWSDIVILQPVDPEKSKGLALVEVSNRGGKFSPRYFNRAKSGNLDPVQPGDFGDELLMKQGLTVIWLGWEFDVPTEAGLLKLHVPIAKHTDGTAITGLVRSDWTVDETVKTMGLGHRTQVPYPASDFSDTANVLTVRNGRDLARTVISRNSWQFARIEGGKLIPDSTHIYLKGGFQAGKIYELVYRAKDPPLVGLGLAAIRDVISYAKYNKQSIFNIDYGIAAGVSQTGRFLRHFLYQGFNTDEQGRKAYDGCLIITAGAGRGSFNHRFAQPSRDAHRYSAFFYPTDIFPFSSRDQTDKITGAADGLLAHEKNPPKIFYINTGYEYWGRAAALIHTSVDGKKDIEPLSFERIYHLASGQHFVGSFPPEEDNRIAGNVYRGNPLDFSENYRALLIALIDWVASDISPPASRYPRIDKGTLVPIDELDFLDIPNLILPREAHTAYRADYGSRWNEGIVDNQPPVLGEPFPVLVPQVDNLGNELGGIRNVELKVPLATYTPWNLRNGYTGGKHEMTDFLGTYIPLPTTVQKQKDIHDPRPAILTLHQDREHYLEKVKDNIDLLVEQGLVLTEDYDHLLNRAKDYWRWLFEDRKE